MIEVFNFEQGTREWFECRKGIPTASMFATVMAKGEGKTRGKYMRELAYEVITGKLAEGYSNANMERGNALEGEARKLYAYMTNSDPVCVGFIRNGDRGASPDSLLGDNGGLEIKVALPHVQIERLERGTLPSEHKAQVFGNILVGEKDWWDFLSYCPDLPPLKLRVWRDEPYLKQIAGAIDAFNEELALLVERIRSYGNPREHLKNSLVQSLMAG